MKPNILYGFYYNGMTEESSYALISLHRSKENAEKAMEEHKASALKEWEEKRNFVIKEYGARYVSEFGKWEDWFVREVEVLE